MFFHTRSAARRLIDAAIPHASAEELSFYPRLGSIRLNFSSFGALPGSYKERRLREMAAMWKGTVLEPHTAKLLSMLLQEDGTLTAERRHDCIKGVCYAIGFMGHHICHRGTPLIYIEPGDEDAPALGHYATRHETYCNWKDGKSPQQQFEHDFPDFAFNWHVQFQEYTLRMTQCINAGKTANQCIQSWNSREVGRIKKVESHLAYVREVLDNL